MVSCITRNAMSYGAMALGLSIAAATFRVLQSTEVRLASVIPVLAQEMLSAATAVLAMAEGAMLPAATAVAVEIAVAEAVAVEVVAVVAAISALPRRSKVKSAALS